MAKVLINQKTLIILNQLKVWIKDNFFERFKSTEWGFMVFKYVRILYLCRRQGGEYPSCFKHVEPEARGEYMISSLITAPFQHKHDLASGLLTPQLSPGSLGLLLNPPGDPVCPARWDPLLALPCAFVLPSPVSSLVPPSIPSTGSGTLCCCLYLPRKTLPHSFGRSKPRKPSRPFLPEVFPDFRWSNLSQSPRTPLCFAWPALQLPLTWSSWSLHFSLLLKLEASYTFDYQTFSSSTQKRQDRCQKCLVREWTEERSSRECLGLAHYWPVCRMWANLVGKKYIDCKVCLWVD